MVQKAILKKGVLQSSYIDIKADIDKLVNTDIDVPFPKDAAGIDSINKRLSVNNINLSKQDIIEFNSAWKLN